MMKIKKQAALIFGKNARFVFLTRNTGMRFIALILNTKFNFMVSLQYGQKN